MYCETKRGGKEVEELNHEMSCFRGYKCVEMPDINFCGTKCVF